MKTFSVSPAGLDLIKTFEGFRAEPQALHDGGWVVGFSHVRIAEAGAVVTEAEAEALLALDLAPFERFVNLKVTHEINQSQFDALVSFCFSVGQGAFEKSDVLRKVNAGQIVPAACAMDAWRKSSVGGESEIFDVLIRRRAAEKALFLKEPPMEGAPSVFLRAEIDHAASILGAPIAYGEVPAVGAAPKAKVDAVSPQLVAAQKLTDILKREEQTTLVLTQIAPREIETAELVTANARPVARNTAAKPAFKLPKIQFPVQVVGLAALFLFGLGLMTLGAISVFGAYAQMADVMVGFALAAPGVAAVAAAAFGLWKGPTPRYA